MKRRTGLAVVALVALSACTSPIPGSAEPTPKDGNGHQRTLGDVTTAEAMTRLCRSPSVKGASPPSGSTQTVVAEVEREVEQIRGLSFLRSVPVEAVSPAQLMQGIQQLTAESLPKNMYARRSLAWGTMGAVPNGTDLAKLLGESSGAGVIGYYQPETGGLRFIGTANSSPDQLVTLAHELTHAIDDQHFDFQKMEASIGACQDDRGLALQSLVEGNATYIMRVWAQRNLSPIALFGVSLKAIAEPHPKLGGVPNFLKDGLFPYEAGLKFVEALVRRGGVQAIDSAFRNPPVSTEQILHPNRYPKDRPQRVDVPDYGPALGPGWKDLDVEEVGEEWLASLLGLRLATSSAEIGSAGWDGGLYRAWSHGMDVAVVLTTVWDSHAQATEFAVRMDDWILGGQQADVLPVTGDRVNAIFATDADTLARLKTVVETLH